MKLEELKAKDSHTDLSRNQNEIKEELKKGTGTGGTSGSAVLKDLVKKTTEKNVNEGSKNNQQRILSLKGTIDTITSEIDNIEDFEDEEKEKN